MNGTTNFSAFGTSSSSSNPFISMGGQASCLIVLSHVLQFILRPFGHPTPFSQILVGFGLGPSGLSRIPSVGAAFSLNAAYFGPLSRLCRMVFVFLVGLEMDIPYLTGNFRPATICAISAAAVCSVFGGTLSYLILHLKKKEDRVTNLSVIAFLITSVSDAATPLVVRTAMELKIHTSDIGRLAIHTSLINDILCLALLDLANVISRTKLVAPAFNCLISVAGVIVMSRFGAIWLNKRGRNQKYVTNAQFLFILAVIAVVGASTELAGFNSGVPCFLMGLLFPRGGKTARTILHKLGYSVRMFILPIYFGSIGFNADMRLMKDWKDYGFLLLAVLSSIGGKICGTVGACWYLKIPLTQVAILPFFLSFKIYIDLPMIGREHEDSDPPYMTLWLHNLTVMIVVVNAVILGPVVDLIVKRDRTLAYQPTALALQNPDNELRVVACVHAPRHVSTMVWLMGASSASRSKPTIPCLAHLIELPEKQPTKKLMSYHQLEMDELSDDDDYGGNDVVLVNDALDSFVAATGVMVRQVRAVRGPTMMYEDVCRIADNARASILFLPFHKHQRIDGKMEHDKEGIRTTNQKVLRHAPCTVAILVDRGLAGGPHAIIHVAALFFGGPDDREALAYGVRICKHPQVNLTVIRFQPRSSPGRGLVATEIDIASGHHREEVLMEIQISGDTTKEVDNVFINDFYHRYVTTGLVGYVEKYVDDGRETAAALRDMSEMYSLFIVGRSGRGQMAITNQMSDWEECPELGTVGDLLASSDFFLSGSVLVMQQCRPSSKGQDDDSDEDG